MNLIVLIITVASFEVTLLFAAYKIGKWIKGVDDTLVVFECRLVNLERSIDKTQIIHQTKSPKAL